MDLDKPLEEMISDKKTTQGARRGNGAPRSRGRGNGPTPYAVSPLQSRYRATLRLTLPQRPPPRSTEEKWVHDAYEDNVARGGRRGGGGGAPRGGYSGFNSTLAGTGVGFTGVSPRIEVVGLHYEVTPADLKVGLLRG